MHCISCGTQLPEGAAFCPTCGVVTPYNISDSGVLPYGPTAAASPSGAPLQAPSPSSDYGSPSYGVPLQNPYQPFNPYAIPPPPPLPHVPTVQQLSKQRNRLSHPRIALIALIGQVLLFAAVAGLYYVGSKYGPNPSGTFENNLLNIINIFTSLGGEACAIIAFVMSLLKTKQLHRWGWFIGLIAGFIVLFIVFLSALIPLLFGIFGPKEQRAVKT